MLGIQNLKKFLWCVKIFCDKKSIFSVYVYRKIFDENGNRLKNEYFNEINLTEQYLTYKYSISIYTYVYMNNEIIK